MVMQWLKGMTGVLVCLMLFTGCLASALAGAGASGTMAGYNWIDGTLTREYPRVISELEQPVLKVCQYYQVKITNKNVSPIKSIINGVDQNGDEVKITLAAKPNNITAVSIHVGGFMGNKEASELFHTKLAKELGL
jgi:hypothetical protein